MKYLFPVLIALSALAVSASAAYYSVFGLCKLFAGASTEVIIMAASLEAAKLVVASLLYRYWNDLSKLIKTYLTIACIVLIGITSMGIYGFLSGAFQETATQSKFLDQQVLIIEKKQEAFIDTKNSLVLEKEQLTSTISDLRLSLSNPAQVSYYSEEAGQVITTTSSSTRKALQAELNKAVEERDLISQDLRSLSDSIAAKDVKILEMQIGNESARELGPLKYVAELTGKPMESIVNVFMLLLIFVFDPLAVMLVVVANMAFMKIGVNLEVTETKVSKPTPVQQVTKVIHKTTPEQNSRLDKIEKWIAESLVHEQKYNRLKFTPKKFDYGDKK